MRRLPGVMQIFHRFLFDAQTRRGRRRGKEILLLNERPILVSVNARLLQRNFSVLMETSRRRRRRLRRRGKRLRARIFRGVLMFFARGHFLFEQIFRHFAAVRIRRQDRRATGRRGRRSKGQKNIVEGRGRNSSLTCSRSRRRSCRLAAATTCRCRSSSVGLVGSSSCEVWARSAADETEFGSAEIRC